MKLLELLMGFIFKVAFFFLEVTVKALTAIISAIWSALMERRKHAPPVAYQNRPRRRRHARR